MSVQILQGDVRAMLATLPDASVQCVVTSPPYFGLRAYGTDPQVWGGDPEHPHVFGEATVRQFTAPAGSEKQASNAGACNVVARSTHCPCGAWRGELGSEPTPSLFIEHLVSIFDEVGRVMRPDAVLFVNLGDSYAGIGKGPSGKNGIGDQEQRQGFKNGRGRTSLLSQPSEGNPARMDEQQRTPGVAGVKAKSLLLVPQRFALAMQDRGWIVRSQIAWCKTSAMPESVRDRPTSAWEVIWMFVKQARYFWDQEAVRQPLSEDSLRLSKSNSPRPRTERKGFAAGIYHQTDTMPSSLSAVLPNPAGANLRNFWLLGPEPLKEAHFASFPSELPRRCILAATSERGQCPACGAPWVRVVERDPCNKAARIADGEVWGAMNMTGAKAHKAGQFDKYSGAKREMGWAPSCQCNAGDPVPQLVLDPFLGSGTTALVADQLGRNAIGIELSPTYAEMARRRITNDCPMFTSVEVAG